MKLVMVGKNKSTLVFVWQNFKKKIENKTTRRETLSQKLTKCWKCGQSNIGSQYNEV